jgi:AcrR family transcriptional regulator
LKAVAERSGSSIGALYNYFPDKQSIAFTLVNQYAQELEANWKPMMEQAEILTHAESIKVDLGGLGRFTGKWPR